jgi:hypothetical protein
MLFVPEEVLAAVVEAAVVDALESVVSAESCANVSSVEVASFKKDVNHWESWEAELETEETSIEISFSV